MAAWHRPSFTAIVAAAALVGPGLAQAQLYTEGPGTNPPFEEIRDNSGANSGTLIDVNNALVEGGAYGDLGIESPLVLHTLRTSVTSNLSGWSRWYQEDGDTQVFRLFEGEENVRNDRPLAARIEAFSRDVEWNAQGGEWHDWVARYTIVQPINAAIFQAKDQDDDAWSVHLNMNEDGDVYATHRRPKNGQSKTVTILENAVGQPFDVRVRDNGFDYEVYVNNSAEPLTSGTFERNDADDTSVTRFRWGMYVGANEVTSDGMIFVSHATIDPPTQYLVGVPDAIPGDFNGDGSVDAADYTLWGDRDARADANGDRRFNQIDYAVWADNYGRSLPENGQAVPEPTGLAWVALGLAAATSRSHRR